jgi:hypothetical protein
VVQVQSGAESKVSIESIPRQQIIPDYNQLFSGANQLKPSTPNNNTTSSSFQTVPSVQPSHEPSNAIGGTHTAQLQQFALQTQPALPFMSLGARRRSAFEAKLAAQQQSKRPQLGGEMLEEESSLPVPPTSVPAAGLSLSIVNVPPVDPKQQQEALLRQGASETAEFNYTRINDWMWIGSDLAVNIPLTEDVDVQATQQRIEQLGISYVINVADNCANLERLVLERRLSLRGYRYFGIRDISSTVISQQFDGFIRVIGKFIK